MRVPRQEGFTSASGLWGRTCSPPGRGPYHLRLRLAVRLGEDDAAGETPRREPDVQGQAVARPLGHGRAREGQGRHVAPPLRPAAPRPRLPRAWAQSPHGGASGTGASRPLGLAPMLALPAWPGPPGPAPECPLRAARLRLRLLLRLRLCCGSGSGCGRGPGRAGNDWNVSPPGGSSEAGAGAGPEPPEPRPPLGQPPPAQMDQCPGPSAGRKRAARIWTQSRPSGGPLAAPPSEKARL